MAIVFIAECAAYLDKVMNSVERGRASVVDRVEFTIRSIILIHVLAKRSNASSYDV
jgi:hypothetical protein